MSNRDMGAARILGADAIGRPGQRRFRLFVRANNRSAILWMEKEQLTNLSLAIDRILAQITDGRILRTEARVGGLHTTGGNIPDDFPASPDYDFQVGQIRLNFTHEQESFLLAALPLEIVEDEKGEPEAYLNSDEAISFLFSLHQAQELTSRIAVLVSSGRPVCPLCHMPLDGRPHACARQNGHREIIQIVEDDADEDEENEGR